MCEQKEFIPYRTLIMVKTICHVCGIQCSDDFKSNIIDTIHLRVRDGWLHCDNPKCIEVIRKSIIHYLNDEILIPVQWLKDEILRFFRFSQKNTKKPLWDGFCVQYEPHPIRLYHADIDNPADDCMIVMVAFGNEDGMTSNREVSLANLFHHNPLLYDKLINHTDLLRNSKIRIGYNDLCPKIKELVEKAMSEAKIGDPYGFLY